MVERRALSPTAVVRIGLPATASLPPFVDWPADLVDALSGQASWSTAATNSAAPSPLDEGEIRTVAGEVRGAWYHVGGGVGRLSPLNADQEQHVAAVLADMIPGVRVSLSHEIGRIGLLERESAAAMKRLSGGHSPRIVRSFRAALAELEHRRPSTSARTTAR
ncbi:MAG: hypothetical protein R2854_21945 [Caldilineaceae bacterium]